MSTHSPFTETADWGESLSIAEFPEFARFLFRPMVFQEPDRLVAPPSWLEHIPFAYWIVDVLRPEVFVELGTQSGNSYASFAEAVKALGLNTACYAIDSWKGDAHSGFYEENVFAEWSTYHDQRFSAFSRLVRSTFDEAVSQFSDRSIDLLHIDGYHSYASISHDFERWSPKLSNRGVILFHDINVREADFGAWRLWEELSPKYPSFRFLHGHGLGVLGIGSNLPDALHWLFSLSGRPHTESAVRQFFSRLGRLVSARFEASVKLNEVATREAQIAAAPEGRDLESDLICQRIENDRKIADIGAELKMVRDQLADARAELDHRLKNVAKVSTHLDVRGQQLSQAALNALTLRKQLNHVRSEAEKTAARLESELALLRSGSEERLAHKSRLIAELNAQIARDAADRADLERERDVLAAQSDELARYVSRSNAASDLWRRRIAGIKTLSNTVSRLPGRPESGRFAVKWPLELLSRPTRLREAYIIASSRLFDEEYYVRCHPDVTKSALSPLSHFVLRGAGEGRNPHPLFDCAWYKWTNPDVASSRLNPFVHYLLHGAREGRDPHPLFWTPFYWKQVDDHKPGRGNALAHYATFGFRRGYSPHPLFDPSYYFEQIPDLPSDVDPFCHYLEHGSAINVNPHPLFDVVYYRWVGAEAIANGINPLVHYALFGAAEKRSPHPLFDISYYLESNPDVRENGHEPLTHFLMYGSAQGRAPNPYFDCRFYVSEYPEVAEEGINPLVHFDRIGWRQGRRPSNDFDTRSYLATNADVRATRTNPLSHFLQFGRAEQRAACPDRVGRVASSPVGVDRSPVVRFKVHSRPQGAPGRPTIVCLSHVMPIPPRAGNEYRIYRLLRWLQHAGYRVVPVIAPLDGPADLHHAQMLSDHFPNAILCGRDGELSYVLDDIPDVLGSLGGELASPIGDLLDEEAIQDPRQRELLQVDRTFCHDALGSTVLRLHRVLGPFVLLAEYVWMSRILPLLPDDVVKIIDTIDVFSTKQRKVLRFGVDDLYLDAQEEIHRLKRADLVLAIQDEESGELQKLIPEIPVVTAGVDFDVSDNRSVPAERVVAYVASDNPMNQRGLSDFLRFAWPRIRRDVPDAELLVAGKVSATFREFPPGVSALGPVSDLQSVYSRARLVINPAIAGTGLKIKIMEALCHLRPVVTWPSGIDGLTPELASLCVTVEDWYEFACRVVDLLTSPQPLQFSSAQRDMLIEQTAGSHVYGSMMDAIAKALVQRNLAPPFGERVYISKRPSVLAG